MSEDSKPTAAVIDLEKERLKAKRGPTVTRKHTHGCRHRHSVVDQRARTVECDDCGAVLDPVQTLWTLATDHSMFVYELSQAKKSLAEARDRLEDTLRQERNARARLQRLQKKLSEMET
jgi:hypothetical protein